MFMKQLARLSEPTGQPAWTAAVTRGPKKIDLQPLSTLKNGGFDDDFADTNMRMR